VSYEKYKTATTTLGPVAIELGQTDIHAPEHGTWGVVTCDACGRQFRIGPNWIYGSRTSERESVEQFEQVLAENHRQKQAHKNCYELSDHPIALPIASLAV